MRGTGNNKIRNIVEHHGAMFSREIVDLSKDPGYSARL